jgi:hypothetical protein
VAILGAIVHHHQNPRGADRIGQQVEERLGFGIDPVQVLEHRDERLIEALAQQQPLDRIERAAAPDVGIHFRQRVALGDSQQRKQIGQGAFEGAIEHQHLAADLLPPLALVVIGSDLEIVLQQIDERHVRRGFAVRDGKGFEDGAAGVRDDLEFMKQPRLADARFTDGRNDLAMARTREFERALELHHVGVASDEFGKSAPRRCLQSRAQRPDPGDFIDVDRIAESLDAGGTERFQLKVSFHQPSRIFGGRDRSGRCQRLHPGRQTGRMSNRRVFGMRRIGLDAAHDRLAGVDADAHLDRRIAGLAQPRRVAPHVILHLERGQQRAMRMVLVRDRRAEQREHAVAGGLHDVAVVAMDRIDHDADRWIDERASLLGIDVLDQIHRAFDIGEQRGDGFALAVESSSFSLFGRESYPVFRCASRLDGAGRVARKSGSASIAEPCTGPIQCTA